MPNVQHMPSLEGRLLTVEQAAELLHITPRAVRHRIVSGRVSAQKIGDGRTSAYVIERSEIDRILREQAA